MLKAQIDIHIERKLTHLFGVLAMVAAHHFCPPWLTWTILLGLGIPLLFLDFARQKNEKLRLLTAKIFGGIMRRRELNGLAGTTYLLIGTIIIFAIFPHNVVALSLLFLAFGDPTASFVGLKFGRHKILGKKTLEGALAAFAICALVSFLFLTYKGLMTSHLMVVSILAGFIGSLSELIPVGKLDDNFTQPVANAIFLYFLFQLFGGLS